MVGDASRVRTPPSAKQYYAMSFLAHTADETGEAVVNWKQYLKLKPDNEEIQTLLKAVESKRSESLKEERLKHLTDSGLLHYEQGRYELAAETWKKTVIDATTVAPAHGHPADIDGDGDLDVLMAFGIAAPVANQSPQSHQVAWYENVGHPGLGIEWKKHSIAASFPQGFEAVAGDLDGDGDQDVVATAWSPRGRLAWFENTGDPKRGWKQHFIKQNWSNAVTVVLADLDKDCRLDIVACAERGANELRWWRNRGPSE